MPRPPLPRPSRRLILTASLLLLAGAVVNVAVAWTLAARANAPTGMHDPDRFPPNVRYEFHQDVPHWLATWPARAGWPAPRSSSFKFARGWKTTIQFAFDGQRHCKFNELAAGWPLRAVRSRRFEETRLGTYEVTRGPAWLAGLHVPRSDALFRESDGHLPLAPIPTGFAINTLFYTVIVGAILALPLSLFPIRRRLRARRGRCPKCGYDLAGLRDADPEGGAPCPECGATR